MSRQINVDVCIVGGGPAGMVLGLLLAHNGFKVAVLESHKDFEREYRGEVLMPRFIQMMKQVKLFDHIAQYPHLKLKNFELFFKENKIAQVDFGDLSKDAPYAIWMPQPVLLNALLDKAKTYPTFHMVFGAGVKDLLRDKDGKIVGVHVHDGDDDYMVNASVTVGADGRFSTVRKAGGFEFASEEYGFDLVWFTVPKPEGYENTVRAFFSTKHRYLILPKYPNHVQCGLLVAKGGFTQIRERGIEALKTELLEAHPIMHDFARSLKDFSDFSVLQAKASYVKQWAKDGCLLIGDSAHTCSPAGAIGVSVAVATAIVAADILIQAVTKKDFSATFLHQVQQLREDDVKHIQRIQSRFAGAVFLQIPWLQWISFIAVTFAARSGVLRGLQRELAVMKDLLPISPSTSI